MDGSLPSLQLPGPETEQLRSSTASLIRHAPSSLASTTSFPVPRRQQQQQQQQQPLAYPLPVRSSHQPGSGRPSMDGQSTTPSHYIPPASDLTVSNHDRLLGVIDAEFQDTDRTLERRDLKAFGANSERIFQELDKIRKKQLALAAKHIGIETIADNDM
ncbi:hypothetical protein DFQ27_009703 [Actinomortierella ambigua]|uniref:Uncharacterized protein n=1 Tax=Actinomortierella ambigua TaxID=1343610 RepID=A0A9P6QE89_9FUNG|nr:hypothetical protein DFQ26_001559 [Actinomortierella ambigua]KAG0266497.1 hypothetical protein DFQ27_009703 [Actinomortierella ambigua]